MDVKELQIGDFVYYCKTNQYITRVIDIRIHGDEYAITCVRDDRDSLKERYKEDLFNVAILNPIPITPEVLEKNGFIKDGYTNLSPDYYLNGEDFNIYINLRSTCDKTAQIWCENRNTKHTVNYEISRHALVEKTLFIHQLQQILRSCKVNKDIVL